MTSLQATLTFRLLMIPAWFVVAFVGGNRPAGGAEAPIATKTSISLSETIADLLRDLKLNASNTNRRQMAETANFRVYCTGSRTEAVAIAQACESLCELLQDTWLDAPDLEQWAAKCDIVLHPSAAEYQAALGRGSEQSSGCSSINYDRGRIVSRRIDICAASASQATDVLPHEMTHIILADVFPSAPPPRWAAEGMAVLAEPHAKQQRRQSGLKGQVSSHAPLRVVSLLGLANYPSMESRGSFYVQSAHLVKFLAHRDSPRQFVRFVKQAESEGYEKALRDVYQIDGVAHLDRIWRTPNRPSTVLVLDASSSD